MTSQQNFTVIVSKMGVLGQKKLEGRRQTPPPPAFIGLNPDDFLSNNFKQKRLFLKKNSKNMFIFIRSRFT